MASWLHGFMGTLTCRRCGSELSRSDSWVVCVGSGRECPPVCASCGQDYRYSSQRKHRAIYERTCGCEQPRPPEYRPSQEEVDRLQRWLESQGLQTDAEVSRLLVPSVAEVASGRTSRVEFDLPDGRVTAISPEVARSIVRTID